jgi:aspartyl-tRNA(Asn)/glutamyl-tRNA(Gln) amidotransferase subunit A
VIDTLRLTAEEAARLLRNKEISGGELWEAYRRAIDDRDGDLHCFLHVCDDPGGDGLPIAVKDVIGTKGIPTTAGSKILEGYVPVLRLHCHSPGKGRARLAHPRQDEHRRVRDGLLDRELRVRPVAQPMGSVARARRLGRRLGAAVSGGLAPWALGSDTGGSIKQPSALCGNVGLRPTYGTVSRYGIVALASSLDQVGPVARTVRDCAFLYSIIAGRDECDTTTVGLPQPVELPEGEDLRGIKIGVPKELNEAEGIEPGVGRPCAPRSRSSRRSVPRWGSARCRSQSSTECPATTWSCRPRRPPTWPVTTASRYGHRAEATERLEMYKQTREEGFGDEPKRRIMVGTYALSRATTTRTTARRRRCGR